MESIEIYFIKVRNRLTKKLYPAVATKVMKKQIEMGKLPREFLKFIEIYSKKRPDKINLKNNWKFRDFVRSKGKCGECGSKDFLEICYIKSIKKHPELALKLSNLMMVCRDCRNKKHLSTLPPV